MTGVPSRFLYDATMPEELLEKLKKIYNLAEGDVVPGGHYHNFSDYLGFPIPEGKNLEFAPQPALPHPGLDKHTSFFDAISEKDHMLHFPYQSYDYVVKFLEEAAMDPHVTSIKITLYRVASNSKVAQALIKAVQNGKSVEVFDEVKARFDEQSNIYWGAKLSEAGAKVRYSYPELKVHTKICVVTRLEEEQKVRYAFLATGNFNEKTARIYCDHGLFTKRKKITKEANRLFGFLIDFKLAPSFETLLVAPFQMRERFKELLDREILHAKEGKEAHFIGKMNSLQDEDMIVKLYEASRAGVKIKLIIRGICCLIPGLPGISENIEVVSIVGRYLEHARVYIFANAGEEEIYLASADWMSRNLSKRIEAGFPIEDPDIRAEIRKMIELQLQDNTKARIINEKQDNQYVPTDLNHPVDAQRDSYLFLKEKTQVEAN